MLEINRNPSARSLRLFAGLQFPITCGVLGAMLYFRAHLPPAGIALWIFGVIAAIAGLIRPPVVKPLYLGMRYAAYPIAMGVTYVLLAVLYYLVVFPVGLVMSMVGRDTMRRKFDPRATSYWEPHDPGASVNRYFSQY